MPEPLFDKVARLWPATLLKKNFAKFLRIPFLIEHLWMTASVRDRKNYPGIYKTTVTAIIFMLLPYHVFLRLCYPFSMDTFKQTFKYDIQMPICTITENI